MHKFLKAVSLFAIIGTFVFAKDGLRVVYLFDVSGSFHQTTVNFATESAEEIFEAIVDKSEGIPEYPQKHFVSTISEQSISIGGYCRPTRIAQPNLYNMTPPNLDQFYDCIEKIRSSEISPGTDIYGALHQSAQILSSNKLHGKAIIMYTDLLNYSGRDSTVINNIDLSDIVVVVLYEYSQNSVIDTQVLKDAIREFELNLEKMGAKKYKIEHLVSVEADEIVEFLEKSFR